MSRVDEAMRRAAAEPEAEIADAVPAGAVFAAEGAAALPRERFAVEMPGERGPRPAPAPMTAPAAATAPAAGEPILPLFERLDARLAEKVVVDENMTPVSREQYRRFAAILHDAKAERGLKVVLIASAVVGEGKTLTAANLALTLSESFHDQVLLIDGDLRRPSLHTLFRVHASRGLSDALMASEDMRLTLHQVSSRLSLLPAGRPQADPMAGLASDRMRRLVQEARETFDWVIIDTPPLVLMPDAPLLAATADGVVLVVRADATPHALAKRAVESLTRTSLLGVVLNGATAPVRGDEYYGAYYPARTRGADA